MELYFKVAMVLIKSEEGWKRWIFYLAYKVVEEYSWQEKKQKLLIAWTLIVVREG